MNEKYKPKPADIGEAVSKNPLAGFKPEDKKTDSGEEANG